MVIETVSFLHKQIKSGKNVLVEGANAAMLDIDFGKYYNHYGIVAWIRNPSKNLFNYDKYYVLCKCKQTVEK